MGAILDVFRVVREEGLAFGIFLGVNLFFGGMALWLPPALATQNISASPLQDFVTALEQGNGYLFGLALLAATSSYWLREYLANKDSDFRSLKMGAAAVAVGIMIIMSILLGAMLSRTSAGAPVSGSALITQGGLTVAAFLTAVYLFCLEHIDQYPEYGKSLKDKTTKEMKAKMDDASKTGYRT